MVIRRMSVWVTCGVDHEQTPQDSAEVQSGVVRDSFHDPFELNASVSDTELKINQGNMFKTIPYIRIYIELDRYLMFYAQSTANNYITRGETKCIPGLPQVNILITHSTVEFEER